MYADIPVWRSFLFQLSDALNLIGPIVAFFGCYLSWKRTRSPDLGLLAMGLFLISLWLLYRSVLYFEFIWDPISFSGHFIVIWGLSMLMEFVRPIGFALILWGGLLMAFRCRRTRVEATKPVEPTG